MHGNITLETLQHEYLVWAMSYGADVNISELTFSELIYEKYNTSHLKVNVRNEKDTKAAFITLLKELYEQQEGAEQSK